MSVPSLARFKRCTSCQMLLPATIVFFTTHKLGKYGLVSCCRVCRRLKSRVPWERHRSNRDRIKEKKCRECGLVKPRGEFHERKTGKKAGVLSSRCRSCDNADRRARRWENREEVLSKAKHYYQANRETLIAKQKEYAEANREKVAAYQKQYRETHQEERRTYNKEYHKQYYPENREKYEEKARTRRARLRGNGGTHTTADVKARYKEQKGKCYWCRVQLNGTYHVDHIIPLSKGGGNGPENICCACPPCNQSKFNKMPWEFSDRLF